MLQAYIDASGSGDPHALVLAGYIARAETWAAFSKEWRARLDEARLSRFKMSEIASSRMEIAAFFYRAIEQFDMLAAVSCVIPTDHLRTIVREFAWPAIPNIHRLENPYYLGFKAIIENVALSQRVMGMFEPIDFIFDDQSEKGPLLDAWDLFKFAATPNVLALLGDTPSFKDDEKVPQLQAADLYAWWVLKWRREGDANGGVRDLRFAWEAKKKSIGFMLNIQKKTFEPHLKVLF